MAKLGYKVVPNVNRCDICCTYISKSTFFMYNHMKRASCLRKPFNCEESILEPYRCEICQLDVNTIIFFKNHIEQEDCRKKQAENSSEFYMIHICENCSFETYSYLVWFKHMNGCSVSTKNVTDKKTKDTKSKNLSKNKVIKFYPKHHNSRAKNQFECGKCMYKTSHKYILNRHFNTIHADDKNKNWLECEHCTYKTTDKKNLKRHIYAKHTTDNQKNWFICEKCPFETSTKRYLTQHIQRLHADNKKLFKCEKRTKTPYKRALKRHKDTYVDDGDKKWHRCMYKTPYHCDLKKHQDTLIIIVENGNKKWLKCMYKTTDKFSLKIHIRLSHMQKPIRG